MPVSLRDKIDVWKYILTILMGLGAFWKEKLDPPDRALSRNHWSFPPDTPAAFFKAVFPRLPRGNPGEHNSRHTFRSMS